MGGGPGEPLSWQQPWKIKVQNKKSPVRTARDRIPDWLICISGARGEDAAVCASVPSTHLVFLDKEPALNQGHPAQTRAGV